MTERDEFEAWAKDNGYPHYWHEENPQFSHQSWEAWKAARAQPSQPPRATGRPDLFAPVAYEQPAQPSQPPEVDSKSRLKRLEIQSQPTRSQKLSDAGYTRRPSLWAMEARQALELIATPMRPDGTWNRDRAACQQLAAEALGRYEETP